MSKSETENSRAINGAAEILSEAVAALRRGEIVVYPTETLYGLGADALSQNAVENVCRLKGRDPSQPLPVLIADHAMLDTLVAEVSGTAQTLMDRFWPGPLTLVLPARKDIPAPLVNTNGGVGVRISSQALATRLVKALGRPLTATSANPAGQEPARTIAEAKRYFADTVQVYIDGGELTSRTGSTVVEVTGASVKLIRAGEIAASTLAQALGRPTPLL